MKFFNLDGSKKFRFSAKSLSSHGLREFFGEVEALRKAGVQVVRPRPPPRKIASQEPQEIRESRSERDSPWKGSILSGVRRDPEADFTLYYIRVQWNYRRFYKIGVTTNNVRKRFGDDYSKIDKVLFEARVIGARGIEKEVLSRFKRHLFPLAVFRDGNGFSEFFDQDVLGLDDFEPRTEREVDA